MTRLSDPERKLLAILRNNSTSKHRVPSLHLLRAKTGRDEAGIRKVLGGLAEKGYVQWSPEQPVEAVELLKTWEEQPPMSIVAPRKEEWWEALV
jgi:hypothetical protein